MKAVPFLALAALGCASVPAVPPAPPPDGPALLRSAIGVTRAALSLHYDFYIHAPHADGVRGEAVWTQGDVVFMRIKEPDAVVQLVVVGDRAWMYHEPTGTWPDPAKLGRPDLGLNFLNLSRLLDRLERRADQAAWAGRRDGADLVDVRADGIDVRVKVEGDVISSARLRGTASEDPSFGFEVGLTVRHVNEWYFLPFTERDPELDYDVDVFHSAEVLTALAARDGIPKALAIRVAVWRDELIAQLAKELTDDRTRAYAEADFIRLGDAAVPALEKMRGVAARRLFERLRKQ
jgi:hypothetical protein